MRRILLLAAAVALTGSVLVATQSGAGPVSTPQHYVVEAGETYHSIAAKFDLSDTDLACANATTAVCPDVNEVLATGRIIHLSTVPATTTTTSTTTTSTTIPPTTSTSTTTTSTTTTTVPPSTNITFPVTAAFYYPWYPETWSVNSSHVFYHPTLGYYDSSDINAVEQHMIAMDYAGINVAIASWWGQGQHSEASRIPLLLTEAEESHVKVAFYYEKEGNTTNPTPAEITADLNYLQNTYGNNPAVAKVNGKIVVFVYNANDLTCAIVDKWKAANTIGAYLDLKVFSGYASCPNQPDSWHQYSPTSATGTQGSFMYAISPGYWRADEASPRLARDINRWATNVASMKASTAKWHIITTFNEWGEGSAIESATEWASASGFGQYLDVLHGTAPPPPPTTTTTIAGPTTTAAATTTTAGPTGQQSVVVGAGDICKIATISDPQKTGDRIRALMASENAIPITLGDAEYPGGAYADFQNCYDTVWGSFKAQTHPAIGNHELITPGAAGYYQYFGNAATGGPNGYYSWTIDSNWVAVSLNSEISGTAQTNQINWLKAFLQANPTKNVLAYMHEPGLSSGQHGRSTRAQELWAAMYPLGVDIILSGHDHEYERFALTNNTGTVTANGVFSAVVGTGGANHTTFLAANSEAASLVKNQTDFGIFKLTLRKDDYDWQFIANNTFTDSYHGTIVR